jgi:hypothetical protein
MPNYYESYKKWKKAEGTIIKDVHMAIIPKGVMRPQYADSWGDYWLDEYGVLQIRAVEMPDLMFSHYILIHEYLEAVRCIRDGISLESIEKWDADHSDHDDPGCIPGATYGVQHGDSMTIERILCMQDGYKWADYADSEPV